MFVKLSSNGQVTIPKPIRQALRWNKMKDMSSVNLYAVKLCNVWRIRSRIFELTFPKVLITID